MTGKEHKAREVVNSGTRLCSFIPETRNIMVSKAPGPSYVLKTGNGKRGGGSEDGLRIPPAGIVGLGLSVSTILLEIVLRDGPDDFVAVLPGFKVKWPQKYADQRVGISIIVQETPRGLFTLKDIEGEAEFHLLNLDKLFIGPVSLKTLRFTPGELSFDQTAVIIGQ